MRIFFLNQLKSCSEFQLMFSPKAEQGAIPLFRRKKFLLGVLASLMLLISALIAVRIFLEQQTQMTPLIPDVALSEPAAVEEKSAGLADSNFLATVEPPLNEISPFSGQAVQANVLPLAVVIENDPVSRAQMRGLAEAVLVLEAPVEGGVTRFLAIFEDSQNLRKIGPVRSARSYLVDFAAEFEAALVHAGGSPAALAQLVRSPLFHFDEDGLVLYRDLKFPKPHNLFVNLAALSAIVQQRKQTEAKINSAAVERERIESVFAFKGKIPLTAQDQSVFTFNFSFPVFSVRYSFDPEGGTYQRFLGGVLHTDAAGVEVRPANVVVKFSGYQVSDSAGRLVLAQVQKGSAWFFSAGKFWQGTWQKSGSRTKFFNSDNSPVSLKPGQTFITILDSAERVQLLAEGQE